MPTATPAPLPIHAPYTIALVYSDATDLGLLTPEERRRYESLRYDTRRRDWLAGRSAAKRAVAERCGVAIDRVRIETLEGGAPSCWIEQADGSSSPLPVSLSIAHCDGVAIAAGADLTRRIGVDLERTGAVGRTERRFFLGNRERDAVDDRDATLAWVLKEAAWKAMRLGHARPFSALQLGFADEPEQLRAVWLDGRCMPARAEIIELPTELALVAAVVEILEAP